MKIALVAAITFTLGATAFAGEVVKKDTKGSGCFGQSHD
jgi:hypothetical protein